MFCVRTKFSSELDALTAELALMSQLARDAVERATTAVEHADLAVAYEVFACDEQLKAHHGSCSERAVLLLALQAPVARDLRHVVTGIQIIDDLSEIGSLAGHIAGYVYRFHPAALASPDTTNILVAMGNLAANITAAAAKAVTDQDVSPVVEPDDGMAELQAALRSTIIDPGWASGAAPAVDIALLGSYFQRCADHAVRIGRHIRFHNTGIHD